ARQPARPHDSLCAGGRHRDDSFFFRSEGLSWENPQAVMSAYRHNPDAVGMDALAVVLIGPHEQRRQGLMDALAGQARVTRELASYPGIDDLSALEASYDVAIVDLDTDPEQGLDIVEAA